MPEINAVQALHEEVENGERGCDFSTLHSTLKGHETVLCSLIIRMPLRFCVADI